MRRIHNVKPFFARQCEFFAPEVACLRALPKVVSITVARRALVSRDLHDELVSYVKETGGGVPVLRVANRTYEADRDLAHERDMATWHREQLAGDFGDECLSEQLNDSEEFWPCSAPYEF